MGTKPSSYIPALRFRWLTPLYDPVLKWGMREERFKQRLIQQANIQPGFYVLDLGCGTGTLTILTRQAFPDIYLAGVDGDRQVLDLAREKSRRAQADIAWDYGLAYDLPYAANTWDRVLSSLVIHHLASDEKPAAFKEILRVLKPGGEFHLVDFGKPNTPTMKVIAGVMRRFEHTQENFDGQLPGLLKNAGFAQVIEGSQMHTIFGPLSFIRAAKAV